MKDPLIKLNKVNLKFGQVSILEDINLEIFPGETVAIIGMNGAGKSSLLQIILGLHKPTSGTVTVNTHKIGYVPQRLEFDRSVPVRVDEFLMTYGPGSKKQIHKELEAFNATNLIPKKLSDLSGGELQKVLIVNALLQKPDLLLLDEATAGIDIHGEEVFYKLIDDIHNQYKITILLVSHDIHHVYGQSSKVVCLSNKICCLGTPEELKTDEVFKKQFGTYLKIYEHKSHVHHL